MNPSNTVPVSPAVLESDWKLPDRGLVGVSALIFTELSLFTIFIVAYLYYIGKSLNGPYPQDVLRLPIFATACLLSSSVTIVLAEKALHRTARGAFRLWWLATILLAVVFLTWTGIEWRHLIYDDHLTISTNLFGATFYSLVGLHASHVIVGLVFLILVMLAALAGFPIETQARRVTILSWYWHFVDAVWVIVFTVVYIIGR